MAKKVLLQNAPASKPGQMVDEQSDVQVVEPPKYVSRGGLKLESALDQFNIEVENKTVADIGASTGGFTDCLLQRGARKVYAVDVGYGQLAWKLRNDPRVVVMEKTNARFLTPQQFPETIDLAVMDVSFIGSNKILEPLREITTEAVLLFKPQFEAGPDDVPKGGVIRDAEVHRRALLDFYHELSTWRICGLMASPIAGSTGNREFLVHLKTNASQSSHLEEDEYVQRLEELLR